MSQHNDLGNEGEAIAVQFLRDKAFDIVATNYRYKRVEVDIIAQKGDLLVAVEVKTRSTTDFGDPQDFVKKKQIQHLITAVDQFVTKNELDVEVRFDIIAILKNRTGTKITHIEDAFLHF